MLSKRVLVSVLVLILVFAQFGCVSGAGGNLVGDVTLGATFAHINDQLQQLIAKAREAGRAVIVQGGSEVALATDNLKNAYADSLNLTMDRVDATTLKAINHLQSAVASLEAGTAADVQTALASAQQAVNTVPFAKVQPQVRSYTPKMVVDGSGQVRMSIEGNFFFAMRPGFTPKIIGVSRNSVLGVPETALAIEPVEKTTQSLVFIVPEDRVNSAVATDINLASLSLHIPYEEGMVFKKKKEGTFRLLVGTVPKSPGTITFSSFVKKTVPQSRDFSTETLFQHSSDDDHIGVIHCLTLTDGYTYGGKRDFVVEWHQGRQNDDWSYQPATAAGNQVCYSVTTIHRAVGTSGKLNFHISAVGKKTVDADYWTEPITLPMTWGETRTFTVDSGQWKVRFVPFVGAPQEFGSPSNHRFLNITTAGSSVQVHVPEAAKVIAQ